MCSPSTALKVNCLIIRYLYFGSVRGDLQEGNVYAKRLRDYASRCQFPHFPSTISRFLCAFGLRNPRFRAFRAQNRGFCAFLAFGTPVFRVFEHKIEVFVRFWGLKPPFSVSVSAITCHQYTESRVCCPAILSSICLGEGLGKPRLCIREVKRLFC